MRGSNKTVDAVLPEVSKPPGMDVPCNRLELRGSVNTSRLCRTVKKGLDICLSKLKLYHQEGWREQGAGVVAYHEIVRNCISDAVAVEVMAISERGIAVACVSVGH